jgi:hypothetical protein
MDTLLDEKVLLHLVTVFRLDIFGLIEDGERESGRGVLGI